MLPLCLVSSSGLRQRQQIPASVARLLPLCLVSFIGSSAEAAKSCFCGAVAAFALGEFHGLDGGGSKILLLWRGCCLCAWWVSSGLRQRQQIPTSLRILLPPTIFQKIQIQKEKNCRPDRQFFLITHSQAAPDSNASPPRSSAPA